MIQLSSPTRVTPRPPGEPMLKVQNSRTVLRSPMTSSHGSPAYFLSCGIAPSELNWKIRLSRPRVVWPSMTQWAPMLVPAPILTWGPITLYGPTLTELSSWAAGSMRAVAWMRGAVADILIFKCRAYSGQGAHGAHQFGLASDRLSNAGYALELEDAGLHALQRHIHDQLVAG